MRIRIAPGSTPSYAEMNACLLGALAVMPVRIRFNDNAPIESYDLDNVEIDGSNDHVLSAGETSGSFKTKFKPDQAWFRLWNSIGWVRDIPVAPGTQTVTVTIKDSMGNILVADLDADEALPADFVSEKVDNFVGDGETKHFLLTRYPKPELTSVTVGGNPVSEDLDFTVNYVTKEIEFVVAPADSAAIVVTYDQPGRDELELIFTLTRADAGDESPKVTSITWDYDWGEP